MVRMVVERMLNTKVLVVWRNLKYLRCRMHFFFGTEPYDQVYVVFAGLYLDEFSSLFTSLSRVGPLTVCGRD